MKSLVWKCAPVLIAAAAVVRGQTTSQENQVKSRGQARPGEHRPERDKKEAGSTKLSTFEGLLLDAGCQNRSISEMRQAPAESNVPATGAKPAAGAKKQAGANADADRSDAMAHQVPDSATRQESESCAITGSTRAFSILMANGRLLRLDEGGNTLAAQAVQSNPSGREMLNGKGHSIKPNVTLKGRMSGDRLLVQELKIR